MGHPVTYRCPRCGTLAAIEREGYLADKAVTPYPLEGWTYVEPTAEFDVHREGGDAETENAPDGVRFVCGKSDGVDWDPSPGTDDEGDESGGERRDEPGEIGCGEPFYLSFVRFEDGREVDPRSDSTGERVRLALGREPTSPRGPSGPGGPDGRGFWE